MDPVQVTVSLNRLTEKETTPVPSPAPIFSKLHDFQLYLSSGLAVTDSLPTLFQTFSSEHMNRFHGNSVHSHRHRELAIAPACTENNVVSKPHAIKLGKFQTRVLKTGGTSIFAASGTNFRNLATRARHSAPEPCLNSQTVTGLHRLCFPPHTLHSKCKTTLGSQFCSHTEHLVVFWTGNLHFLLLCKKQNHLKLRLKTPLISPTMTGNRT